MFIEHELPKEVQYWIVGKSLPADYVTLKDLGITKSGFSVYLYLMKPQLSSDDVVDKMKNIQCMHYYKYNYHYHSTQSMHSA